MLWKMTIELVFGVLAAASAAVCFDGAVVLQAREAQAVEHRHGLRLSLLRRLVARPRWVAGAALGAAGIPLQLGALALAPVTVVQPTLALGMLVLLAAGGTLLGEHVGRREWLAAGAVIAGVALLTLGAPRHSNELPAAGAAALPVAGLAAVALLPFALGGDGTRPWVLIGAAGCAFALAAVLGKLLVVELAAGRFGAAIAFAAAAGASTGVGTLVDMTALQRLEATRAAPPMFVVETAVPVALAPWLFGEAWPSSRALTVALVAGLALVLGGGGLLGSARSISVLRRAGDEGEDPRRRRGPGGVGEVRAPG